MCEHPICRFCSLFGMHEVFNKSKTLYLFLLFLSFLWLSSLLQFASIFRNVYPATDKRTVPKSHKAAWVTQVPTRMLIGTGPYMPVSLLPGGRGWLVMPLWLGQLFISYSSLFILFNTHNDKSVLNVFLKTKETCCLPYFPRLPTWQPYHKRKGSSLHLV